MGAFIFAFINNKWTELSDNYYINDKPVSELKEELFADHKNLSFIENEFIKMLNQKEIIHIWNNKKDYYLNSIFIQVVIGPLPGIKFGI